MSKTIAALPPSVLPRDVTIERVIDTPNPQIAIIFTHAHGTMCVRVADVNCYELIRRMTDVLFSIED